MPSAVVRLAGNYHRKWLLSIRIVSNRNAALAIFIVLLELGSTDFVTLPETIVSLFATPQDTEQINSVQIPAGISLALDAAIDILIAGSLSIYLLRGKQEMSDLNSRRSPSQVLPATIEFSGLHFEGTVPSSDPESSTTTKSINTDDREMDIAIDVRKSEH
ncbi:hypothetical protein D9619_008510 [Psilocybe cf. subviscida]|uniref:Uncharacterized protein n=1 Tax=Psilocybe cf. subviscida TaxID=2480587 RepID=A0A8H5B9I6_9AGAR|nr:hypothetical protein D9619_008510 [Psilocybe cf. subviscida]